MLALRERVRLHQVNEGSKFARLNGTGSSLDDYHFYLLASFFHMQSRLMHSATEPIVSGPRIISKLWNQKLSVSEAPSRA